MSRQCHGFVNRAGKYNLQNVSKLADEDCSQDACP